MLPFGMKKFIHFVKEYKRICKKFSNESKGITNNKFKNDSEDVSEAAWPVPLWKIAQALELSHKFQLWIRSVLSVGFYKVSEKYVKVMKSFKSKISAGWDEVPGWSDEKSLRFV